MSLNEDIIWDTITESAKERFDYIALQSLLSECGHERVAENVLFLTILGHAQGKEINAIASELTQQFLLLGFGGADDELREFVKDRLNDLSLEIKATQQAMTFIEMGVGLPGILVQVRSILSS